MLGTVKMSTVSCSEIEFKASSCSDTIEHNLAGPISIGN